MFLWFLHVSYLLPCDDVCVFYVVSSSVQTPSSGFHPASCPCCTSFYDHDDDGDDGDAWLVVLSRVLACVLYLRHLDVLAADDGGNSDVCLVVLSRVLDGGGGDSFQMILGVHQSPPLFFPPQMILKDVQNLMNMCYHNLFAIRILALQ